MFSWGVSWARDLATAALRGLRTFLGAGVGVLVLQIVSVAAKGMDVM